MKSVPTSRCSTPIWGIEMSDPSNTCIEFDNVVSGYKDFMILNNLSLKVRRGAIT